MHERNVESDFLLIVLRDLLKHRSDLRIVLMSATLNADTFAQYFERAVTTKGSVPKLHVTGFTFPVDEKFLEESSSLGLLNLKGHRAIGGMRASIYNAVPEDAVNALISFMSDFEIRYG